MCFVPKQSEAGECQLKDQLDNLVNMVSKVKNGGRANQMAFKGYQRRKASSILFLVLPAPPISVAVHTHLPNRQ